MIPCISLWQPWASAIVTPHPNNSERGIKEYETRHWDTKVRGRILVHAAKKWDHENMTLHLNNPAFKMWRGYIGENPPRGAIVGSVEILDMITSEKFIADGPLLSSDARTEFYLGNWGHGRYGWKLARPVLFDKPIPYRGQQGFWKVPIEEVPEEYRHLFQSAQGSLL